MYDRKSCFFREASSRSQASISSPTREKEAEKEKAITSLFPFCTSAHTRRPCTTTTATRAYTPVHSISPGCWELGLAFSKKNTMLLLLPRITCNVVRIITFFLSATISISINIECNNSRERTSRYLSSYISRSSTYARLQPDFDDDHLLMSMLSTTSGGVGDDIVYLHERISWMGGNRFLLSEMR